jgi:hypothetical protein
MKYLILAIYEGTGNRHEVVVEVDESNANTVREKAREIYDLNKVSFKNLKIQIFVGDYDKEISDELSP